MSGRVAQGLHGEQELLDGFGLLAAFPPEVVEVELVKRDDSPEGDEFQVVPGVHVLASAVLIREVPGVVRVSEVRDTALEVLRVYPQSLILGDVEHLEEEHRPLAAAHPI